MLEFPLFETTIRKQLRSECDVGIAYVECTMMENELKRYPEVKSKRKNE
jgi:hypothetical protein